MKKEETQEAIRKSIRQRFRRAEPARRKPVRKRSPNAHIQSYVHAGFLPIEKTAIQADISGKPPEQGELLTPSFALGVHRAKEGLS